MPTTSTGNVLVDAAIGILEIAAAVGAVFAGIGYCIGQYKGGSTRGKLEALQISEEERNLLRERVSRLEGEAKQLKLDTDARENALNIRLAKLEAENTMLRDLVNGTSVHMQLTEAIADLKGNLAKLPADIAAAVVLAVNPQ